MNESIEREPLVEPHSEILTILDAEAYWNIGRMGCHDITPPVPRAEPTDSGRYMRIFKDEETGLWDVEIDPA